MIFLDYIIFPLINSAVGQGIKKPSGYDWEREEKAGWAFEGLGWERFWALQFWGTYTLIENSTLLNFDFKKSYYWPSSTDLQ